MFLPESLAASGKSSANLNLPSLQSKMKSDPEGYFSELRLIIRRFDSSLDLFRLHSALNPSSDPALVKEVGDLAMFLAHMTPFYSSELAEFPRKVADLLRLDGRRLPSGLRCHLTQALILLINRKVVGIEETLELFVDLQVFGDRVLRKLAFAHVVHTIRRMNQKHKNEAQNRKLQSVLFSILQGEDEARSKRALVILCDLHRRRVWFDDRTANAICTACFHPSSRILISTLSFLLGYERAEGDNDSDESGGEDDTTSKKSQIILNRDAVYKAHHKGTFASKKKKKAKLVRVMRSMKRKQRLESVNSCPNSYSPLTHLQDAQGFVEKLFSRLQKCNERFEVKMMILKVIARTIGMHQLILLNFYPFLQKYVQPHQRDVTELLAAAVQACHYMVPPDAVEPLFKQVVNQFVHDRSRTEAIAVGLNVVREICLRIPLLMNEDLLQDLVLYKKSHEKAVSTAARSLITLFRQICPSLLVKKDRGRPSDPKAMPRAFGEVSVASDVPDLELLQEEDDDSEHDSPDDELDSCAEENVEHQKNASAGSDDDAAVLDSDEEGEGEDDDMDEDDLEDANSIDSDADADDVDGGDDDIDDDDEVDEDGDADDAGAKKEKPKAQKRKFDDYVGELNAADASLRPLKKLAGTELAAVPKDVDGILSNEDDDVDVEDAGAKREKPNAQNRKFDDYIGQLNAADTSLRALKKLAAIELAAVPTDPDGILSNEDFQRIRELKAKKEARLAMGQHGLGTKSSDPKAAALKIPSSEQLSLKRVDPAILQVNIRRKQTKEERLALVIAGREDRGKYQARAAVKQKKTGGLSNKQKEHKKVMPHAAKKARIARSRQEKKKKARTAGKQFRGKKAWK